MRITFNTPIADAATLMVARDGDRAEAVCRKRADEATNPKSRDMWTAIADTIAGNPPAEVHVDGDWVACYNNTQWGHHTNRAAIYLTATGYEWEVFGVARGLDAPTLDEAKAQVEEAMK
jgi:hypothetical protein